MRLHGLLLLSALAACTTDAEEASKHEPASRGQELFEGAGSCSACHGRNGEGTMLGIPLAGRASRWDAPRLEEYLRDPKAYAASHPEVDHQRMPAAPDLSAEDLTLLAEHCLSLMGSPR